MKDSCHYCHGLVDPVDTAAGAPPEVCGGCWALVRGIERAPRPLLARIISATRPDLYVIQSGNPAFKGKEQE